MTALPADVFATPAAMAEHGARVRAAWAAARRLVARWAAAVVPVSPSARRAQPDHPEMARRRLMAGTLAAMRAGAYADVALGGPSPR